MKKGKIVLFSSEEDPSDTLRPKCERHGADLSQIYVYPEPFELNSDGLVTVEEVLSSLSPVALVVFDTLQNYFGGKDMNKVNEVAEVMTAIQSMAKRFSCAVICVRHLKKGADKANYRGMGSIGITGAARSEVLLGSNPKNTAELAMIHTKSNCAPYGQSLGFKIEKGVLIPTGPTALTADDLMALNLSGSEERSALEEAVEFLIESLRYGKVPAKKIQREANEVGISERTLKRAKKEIKVECNKVGDQWFWSIPSGPKNEEGQLSHVAPLAPFPVLAPLNGSDDENQGIFNMGTV